MASELQRVNRGYDSMSRDNYGSPEDDDDSHAQYGDYGAGRNPQDLDRKRRKRVFSNRTKTGCMTCRRRKKKCDEQHPECEFIRYSTLTSSHSLNHFISRVPPTEVCCNIHLDTIIVVFGMFADSQDRQ